MPSLSVSQIDNANLAWIVEVFVKDGVIQGGQELQFWTLLIGERSDAVKPSRVSETQLYITVDNADAEVLGLIKGKLLTNQSLEEARESIAAANWVSTMKVAQL